MARDLKLGLSLGYWAGGQWWVGRSTGASLQNTLWGTVDANAVYVDTRNGNFV